MPSIDNPLSILDNFFIGEFFPIAREAYKTLKTTVLAQQTTNSRYVTALSLFDEWYQIAEDLGDSDEFRIWLVQRLNAEK